MSDPAAFSKDPLTTSHGDSLADQSFQSLKSKEIRDSMSPTHDIKFHALALNQQPNSTGWNVQASTEVSPDGRAYRTETLATTDGIEKINGGLAEFKGRNEQRSSASHQGDDKNFVKKAADSSSTHLQEHVVIGDENSGRIEKKVSSTTSSSTSEFISSSTTGGDFIDRPAAGQPRYLADSHLREQQQRIKEDHYHQQQQHRIDQERQAAEAQHRQGHRMTDQERREREERITEEYNRRQRQETSSRKVETTQQTEQTKRYVDMDKASPEYQQHVQYLMAQEGEIISNTVEYPKPNVKMITTVKRLPDGTIVRNKRYETEEINQPSASESRRTSTTQEQQTNRTAQQKRTDRSTADNLQTRIRESRENQRESVSPQKQSVVADVVDNVVKQYSDAEEVSYSSVQKSSRKFSTETSSETVEQYSDRPGGPRPTQTQGFPSVKPGVATQEFPNERPFGARPSDGYSTQGFPSVRPDKLTQEFRHQSPQPASPGQTVTKTIGPDGEIIVTVSKESVRNVKQKSSSEHVEIRESREGSTHGFPSVRDTASPIVEMPQTPLQQRRRSKSPDFSTHGFPSARSPTRTTTTVAPRGCRPSEVDGELIQVSSEKSQKSSYKTNSEHIVETKVVGSDDYSTNGFPSVRSPTKSTSPSTKPDFSTHGFPSVRETSKVDGRPTQASPQSTAPQATPGKTQPTAAQNAAGARKFTNTSTTTDSSSQRFVQKEKETDAAHRAFAASLRSSSPIDGGQTPRRGDTPDYHLRPRSSVSSGNTTTTKTYRRDQREGSHDSTHNAPSESSRISSHTVTRQSTPGKPTTSSTAARTSLTKQTTSSSTRTRQVNGSNETIDLVPSTGQRSTKSPSPAKTITTKTSSTTINTNKAKPTAVTTTTTTITSSSPAPASPTVSPVVAKPGPDNNNKYRTRTPTTTTTTTISPITNTNTRKTTTTTTSKPSSTLSLSTIKPNKPEQENQENRVNATPTSSANLQNSNFEKSTNNELPSLTIKKVHLTNNDAKKQPTATTTSIKSPPPTPGSPALSEVFEAPCVKKNFYKVGPVGPAADLKDKEIQINQEAKSSSSSTAKHVTYANDTNPADGPLSAHGMPSVNSTQVTTTTTTNSQQ